MEWLSILLESYCNSTQSSPCGVPKLLLSILLESYCNEAVFEFFDDFSSLFQFSQSLIATGGLQPAHMHHLTAFNSPRVLLQRVDIKLIVGIVSWALFQFSQSLIATLSDWLPYAFYSKDGNFQFSQSLIATVQEFVKEISIKGYLSILLESYCNPRRPYGYAIEKILSILLESYCNPLRLLGRGWSSRTFNSPRVLLQQRRRSFHDNLCLAFNSPRVLLQQGVWTMDEDFDDILSILLESYCNMSKPDFDIRQLNPFQFSQSLIATCRRLARVALSVNFQFSQSLIATSLPNMSVIIGFLLSILLESYCNDDKRVLEFMRLYAFNSPRVLLQRSLFLPKITTANTFNSPRVLLQHGRAVRRVHLNLDLSILLESYCNYMFYAWTIFKAYSFNSPRVLLQLYVFVKLLIAYVFFQFSQSLIATGAGLSTPVDPQPSFQFSQSLIATRAIPFAFCRLHPFNSPRVLLQHLEVVEMKISEIVFQFSQSLIATRSWSF